MSKKQNNICQECKAVVFAQEVHTYSHCLIAKAYPDRWRDIVMQVRKDKSRSAISKQRGEG